MSFVNDLRYIKRRPPVKHITPEEAIIQLNSLVDDCNNKIAKAIAFANQWQAIAAEQYEEVERLRVRVAELERQLKQATPKAGKAKRWRVTE